MNAIFIAFEREFSRTKLKWEIWRIFFLSNPNASRSLGITTTTSNRSKLKQIFVCEFRNVESAPCARHLLCCVLCWYKWISVCCCWFRFSEHELFELIYLTVCVCSVCWTISKMFKMLIWNSWKLDSHDDNESKLRSFLLRFLLAFVSSEREWGTGERESARWEGQGGKWNGNTVERNKRIKVN